jgi:hypothetical protein
METNVPAPDKPPYGTPVVSGGVGSSAWSKLTDLIVVHKLVALGVAAAVVLTTAGTLTAVLLHNRKPQNTPIVSTGQEQTTQPQGDTNTTPNKDTPKSTSPTTNQNTPKPKTPTGNSQQGTGNTGSSGGQSTGGGGTTSGGGGTGGSGTRCAAFPSFPDAACTGPTTTLSLYSGSLDFYASDQVVENVEIHLSSRGIYLAGHNVTFRNVKVVWDGPMDGDFTMVNVNNVTSATFENCEFDGSDKIARAISGNTTGSGIIVRNCNLHNTGNGVEMDGPMLVEENYMHSICEPRPNPSDWHADGVQSTAGDDNITIRHNTITTGNCDTTSAINVHGVSVADPATNILVEHNLLAGGGYTIYPTFGSNYQVIDNHFSTMFFPNVGSFGIWSDEDASIIHHGNIIHETSATADTW